MRTTRESGEEMYSVVIPVYNHERYIEAAIHSVQEQTSAATEIIVIDDGSSDRSAEVVTQLAALDERIVFWRQPNRGAHATINSGIQRATTEYVAILNSDDLFEPSRMECCLAVLRTRPDVDVVGTEISFIDSEGRSIGNDWYEQALVSYRSSPDVVLAMLNANFLLTTSNLVVRRSLFELIGCFSRLRYAHDLEFFVRMLRSGIGFEFLSERLLKYRTHASNTISENHNMVRVEWAAIIAWHLCLFIGRDGNKLMDTKCLASILNMVRTHRLEPLVQYFTWVSSKSLSSGVSPFEHPHWAGFSRCALELDR